MGVKEIIVRDNTFGEVKKLAERLEGMEAGQGRLETNQEKLQTDITQIKEDVKPRTEL